MVGLTDADGTEELEPSELIADEVDFNDEVGFYTDDPTTPAHVVGVG